MQSYQVVCRGHRDNGEEGKELHRKLKVSEIEVEDRLQEALLLPNTGWDTTAQLSAARLALLSLSLALFHHDQSQHVGR